MMPTDEERIKLEELQHAAEDVLLGSAEQFLAILCGIPDLLARLRLWTFKLDYETTESVSIFYAAALINNTAFSVLTTLDKPGHYCSYCISESNASTAFNVGTTKTCYSANNLT